MEVPVNQDIREYKIKDVGNFTLKEFVHLIISAICAYAAYAITKAIIPENTDYLIYLIACAVAAAPGILFGFVNIYGIPFKDFLKTVLVENFFNPKTRPYVPEQKMRYEDILTEEEISKYFSERTMTKKEKKERLKEIKKNPQCKSYK